MAKKIQFTNLADLEKYMKNDIPKALSSSEKIRRELRKAMTEAVQEVVYDHYAPKEYKRRGRNGGLLDSRLMDFTNAFLDGNTFVMIFENIATGNDTLKGEQLTDTIEDGIKENWGNSNGPWSEKRPFMKETLENILANPKPLITAIKLTLVNAGYKIR